ncbi:MAG: transketolase [Candidatus Babeliales bacterium]
MNNQQLQKFLEYIAYNVRVSSIKMTTKAGSGHPTSALSAADIVAALFFYAMRFDPKNPNNPNNDRFILSKGHAAPVLYAIWKELGLLSEEDLMTYREIESVLEGHPTLRFSRTEAATGSLGQGLSIAAGMAYVAKMDKKDFYTYCLIGDMESMEGSIWEATEIAAFYKLNQLIGILDCNRLGQSAPTIHEHNVNRYANKFDAFGWHVLIVDGHNMQELMQALDQAKTVKNKPSIIIAKTIKGYGVTKAEDEEGFHGKPFKKENLDKVLNSLEQHFKEAAHYTGGFEWKPTLPEMDSIPKHKPITLPVSDYKKDDKQPTRKAYGQAIAAVGDVSKQAVSLDAEVKNSTYAEIFEEKHPDRFVQCFIAEQNMIGMAVGMARLGKIPFASTFGAFFTRAFDQIRMAAIGQSPLRLTGSHAGVSIGQDGPSQMALEDIAIMRTLPDSVVLYPSDAVSTYKLVELMANRNDGITYLRTTRMATPILYKNDEQFSIGSCKVLHQSDHDAACVIGAGVTLHEALKAYNQLKMENIYIAVIDLYSIKPLAHEVLLRVGKQAKKRIITVEDHYLEGGIGQAVTYDLRNDNLDIQCLAVEKLPRSGLPEILMHWEKIDSAAIIEAVKKKL